MNELIVYNNIVAKYGLASKYESIRQAQSEGTDGNIVYSDNVVISRAMLGSNTITDLPAYLNRSPAASQFPSILGGEILKRFHWILNIKRQVVYLKANTTN